MTEAGMNFKKKHQVTEIQNSGKTCTEKLFWLTGRQQTIFIIKSPVTFSVIPILISFSLKRNFITHSGTTHFRATRYLARYLYVSIMYDICIVYESKTLQHTISNNLRPSSHQHLSRSPAWQPGYKSISFQRLTQPQGLQASVLLEQGL